MPTLKDKSIVLAITGGIAAYKSAELARLLVKQGARVRTIMTRSATRFIAPLTFQTLTNAPVAVDMWENPTPHEIEHVSWADWADLTIVAPATANIIGKMAGGLGDDFVSTYLLAARENVLICPAMNVNMYNNPAVQENIGKLRAHGRRVLDPGSGMLACGYEGQGRLAELADITAEAAAMLAPQDLAGRRVVVTAGPTRERWDDIRFLTNLSSGLMGWHLAAAARERGAAATLVTGPTALPKPPGVETVNVESTLEMLAAVEERFAGLDALVMAAAPADFRPASPVAGKIKKAQTPEPIQMTPNPDILKTLLPLKKHQVVVGFAAESQELIERAKGKLKDKGLDLIVANQIGLAGSAFAAENNQVHIINPSGEVVDLPLMPKQDVAHAILDRMLRLWA